MNCPFRFLMRGVFGGVVVLHVISIIFWEYKHVKTAEDLDDSSPNFFQWNEAPNNTIANVDSSKHSTPEVNLKFHQSAAEILQSPQLPDWVKQYTEWHKSQRNRYLEARRNNSSDDSIRFLISRCLRHDQCGGASDRLQDMPYNIMVANQTNRVLLIKWEKPAPLEHYLLPPIDGIDWTVPDGMFDYDENLNLRRKESGDDRIVSIIRRDSAAPIFRKYENEVVGHKIYHHIFYLLFSPSQALSKSVQRTMKSLELVPSQYSSVHLRVKYPDSGIDEKSFTFEKHKPKIVEWANNAINCAVEMHPNSTIYVSSDNNDTVGYLMEQSRFVKHYLDAIKYNRSFAVKLAARDYSTENEHLAFSTNPEADSFMSIFVDLMIIALGKCVSHGVGGFGRLGAALSGGECAIAYRGRYSKVCPDILSNYNNNI